MSVSLEITTVSLEKVDGRVGITSCPGIRDRLAFRNKLKSDLLLDLDAIRDWGAAAVVTLLEKSEMSILGVEGLVGLVLSRNMRWFHLPIVDRSPPNKRFEERWKVTGKILRDILKGGQSVLVHCHAGLGRSGTIAARILIEHGVLPVAAIRKVRRQRLGAIETLEQEQYLLNLSGHFQPSESI